jgi:hypothetical protein
LVRREGFVLLLLLMLLMLLLLMLLLLMGWPQLTLLLLALEFLHTQISCCYISIVADPELDPDPYVFGPPESGSISTRYGSGSGSFYHQAKKNKKNLNSNCLLTSL